MLTARPEVKRTYSRIKKDTEASEVKASEVISSSADVSMTLNEAEVQTEEFDVVKADKMRKITDFFKVKRSSDESEFKCLETLSIVKSTPEWTLSITSSPLTSVSNKLKQTYLDLGQKNLISSQCPECLMHYNKSFPDDVALHKKFHAQYLKGYNFTVKPGETVSELAPKDLKKWSKFRFYQIKKFEANLIKKMDFFLNFVHVQLGAEPLTFEELKESGRYDAIVAVEANSSKIVVFGLFEKCSKVFKSLQNCDNSAIELEKEEETSTDCIGVSRIWTDEKFRSMGLASTLLDLKCKGFRERIAFSQPTPAGFAFAKSYQRSHFNGNQCLIYLK